MGDLGQLLRLFEIGRMGRGELERLVSEMDELDADEGLSLRDMEARARASSEVASTERLLGMANGRTGSARGGASRKRKVSVDMDSYERNKEFLAGLADARAAREELREAARGRLRHFEKRDGYLYRPAGSTPLERYQEALRRLRN
jgi:hypothetical protein